MPLVRTHSWLSHVGIVVAVVAATGIAGLLVSLDGNETEAALDSPDHRVDLATSVASIEPEPAVRAEPARFVPQIPAELFNPQSLAQPVARSIATPPLRPTQSEATGSVPPAAAVPLPKKRIAHEKKPELPKSNRYESASSELARIKATLKLTPSQERYWPPVEAALRDILTQIGYESDPSHGTKATAYAATSTQIDPAQVQRLTSAAMPLIMTFDEAQKREVRRLARIMGLENVASAI